MRLDGLGKIFFHESTVADVKIHAHFRADQGRRFDYVLN
jgi:hypothetical protein